MSHSKSSHRRKRPPRSIRWSWLGGTLAFLLLFAGAIVGLHEYQAPRLAALLKQNAESLLAAGDRDEGLRRLRLYCASQPTDIEAATRLGLALSSGDRPSDLWDSQSILLREVRSGRATTPIWTALLKLHLRMGEKGEALRAARDIENKTDLTCEGARLAAEAYYLNKRTEDALRLARQAVELDRGDLISLAYYLPLVHEISGSVDTLKEETLQRANQASDRATALLVGYTALRNAGVASADDLLDQAIQLAPTNVEVLLMAGGRELERNPVEAQRYFESAHELAPQDPRVQLVFGRWLIWAGRSADAADIYRAGWTGKSPFKFEFAWRLAEMLIEQKSTSKELAACLETVLESESYQGAYRFLRGRADMLAGKTDEAENHLLIGKRLVEQLPSFSPLATHRDELGYKIDLGLAGIAYQKNDLAKAARLAEEAHLRLPREFVPLITLGQIHFEQGEFEQSEEAWAEAAQQPFRPAGALLGLARTRLALFNEKPASERNANDLLDLIEQAKLQTPNDPNLTLLEAEALFAASRASEALDELRASAQLFESVPNVSISLIRLLIASDQLPEAQKRLQEHEKKFKPNWLTSIAQTSLLAKQGDYLAARSLLADRESLFVPAVRSTRLRLMGHLSHLVGEEESARTFLTQAVKEDPNDDDAWMFLWCWTKDVDGPEAADRLAADEGKKSRDATVRWRWADSVRTVERHRAYPLLAASTLAEHSSALDKNHRQHWATWHVKGLEAEANGRVPEAITCYLKAIARGPALPVVTTRCVRRLLASHRVVDAEGILTHIRRQRLPLVEDRMLQAEVALAQDENQSTLALVKELIETIPPARSEGSLEQRVWATGMLFQLGLDRDGSQMLAQLDEAAADDTRLWLLHAALERRKNGSVDTKRAFEQIERSVPPEVARFLTAQLALAMGQLEQADARFREAWEGGTLSESQSRTLIDFLRWRKDEHLQSVVDRARVLFPAAPWLDGVPGS